MKSAPAFTLLDASGKSASLKDFVGKYVVLYFYPKDDTPGCTIEAKEFTQLSLGFRKANTVVLGISPDTCASHAKFIDKHKLAVKLLADPERKAIIAYDVWKEKKFMGREYMGVERSTFLIDKKGKLVAEWRAVKAEGHAEKVLKKVDSLRVRAQKES